MMKLVTMLALMASFTPSWAGCPDKANDLELNQFGIKRELLARGVDWREGAYGASDTRLIVEELKKFVNIKPSDSEGAVGVSYFEVPALNQVFVGIFDVDQCLLLYSTGDLGTWQSIKQRLMFSGKA